MHGSLLLPVFSGLLILTAAAPSVGHSHAHLHRNVHDSIKRGQAHAHGHSRRNAHDALAVPAIKPRADTHAGCGKVLEGKGEGQASAGSADTSSSVGGILVPFVNAVHVAAGSSTTPEAGTTTIVRSSTVTVGAPSTAEALEAKEAVAAAVPTTTTCTTSSVEVLGTNDAIAAAVPTNVNVIEAFQKSHTLVTSYTAATVVTPASTTTTAAVGKGSGSGSDAQGKSDAGPLPTGSADSLTVVVRNLMDSSLTTSHGMNDGLPAHVQVIKATLTDGTMRPGATATLVYPSGWAGMMVAAKAATSADEVVDLANGSLLEGSFVKQMGDDPVGDIDISYVSGYTVPITCTCENAKQNTVVTFGCSTDLFDGDADGAAPCPAGCFDDDLATSCLVGSTCNNPLRKLDVPNLTPAKFFARCQGTAFTYAQDTANSQNSQCTTNYISCCIGTEADGCPKWNAAVAAASS